ncbi:MAG: T9SS type A sorting domain-containing protein, partial [Flavobacteriales bacterium]
NEGWNQDNVGGGSSDSFICKFRMSGNTILQTRGTLYGGAGEDYITSVALAPNGNLFVGGWSIIATIQDENDWCTPPADNTFPMCNLNGLNYMETNISTTNGRAFVGAFLPNGQMRWSTQYGEGYGSYITGVTANADKAWVVGRSAAHWTPEEYDENSLADYYRDFDPGNGVFPEAAIARFDIQTIVGINESSQEPPIIFNLFPNPTNQDITLQLGKDLVNQQVEIRVYDMLGQLVLNTKSANTEFIPLTIEALAAGTYTLTLICAESNLLLHQAFVKQ